jgi:hypothetical protein
VACADFAPFRTLILQFEVEASVPRRTFLGVFHVMGVKKTHEGKPLKPGQVLVKLREPGGKPFWRQMSVEELKKGIYREFDTPQ